MKILFGVGGIVIGTFLMTLEFCLSELITDETDFPELKYLNLSADPCENFYAFTCGNYKQYHPRPENESISDHFSLLENELIELASDILAQPKSDEDPIAMKKVKSAYKACIDIDYANNLEIPELRIIEEVGGMPLLSTNNTCAAPFGWNDIGWMHARFGIPLLFDFELVGQFYSETDFYVYLKKDSLSNPSFFRPKYEKTYDQLLEESFIEFAKQKPQTTENRSAQPRAPFDIFLETVSKRLLSVTNPWKPTKEVENDLNEMATFMRQLYAGGIVEANATIEPLDNFVTLDRLQEWTRKQFGDDIGLDWVEYLGQVFSLAGVEINGNVTVMQVMPQVIYGTINLVRQTDPNVIKNFALLRVFLFLAPDSDRVIRQAFENYYNAKGYKLYSRHDYCTRKILDASGTAGLNFAVTYDYQRYHFNINKISKAIELVQSIELGFKEILKNIDWMDDESRNAALRKVDKMLVLLAYPDFINDKNLLDQFYKNVRVCEWDNYGNAQRIRAFKQAYLFSQIGKPRDRTFWDKSTFDANAYYNRANNKIVFPIAMLNPVFFYGNNTILDYSRIGSIIGHEITHGFDNSGKSYNEDGLQIGWWSNQTQVAFDERAKCFINQYDQYYIDEIDAYVNGTLSLNENIADNGGIRQSFKAFKKLLKTQKQIKSINSKNINNFTDEQLFFIGYGTMWCVDESIEYLEKLITDSYAPTRYRLNGVVSNMAEFSEAFNCPSNSKMNPINKCILWG